MDGVIPAFARALYVSSPYHNISLLSFHYPRKTRGYYLEYLHSSVEKIHNLLSHVIIISVTTRRKRVNAGPMFVPLVLPETLRCSFIRQPVRIHKVQEVSLACSSNYIRDIRVLGSGCAVGGICAIAEIRPYCHQHSIIEVGEEGHTETVQSPAISRADCRIGIPELCLEELTTGIDEAAAIRSDSLVVAGERTICRAAGGIG